ncbi:MAG: YceI family protein [bacterium]
MKKNHLFKAQIIFTAFMLVAATHVLSAPAAKSAKPGPDTYKIDPVHTTAFFKVGHLNIGFVRGGFTDISGTVAFDKKNTALNSVSMTINVASIFTNNAQRDTHLKSPDFFDADKYPTMSFKSKTVTHVRGNLYKVTGDFTLHGVTKSITVAAQKLGEGKDPWGGYRAAFESSFNIRRSDYGMTKEIPAAGDLVEITLIVEGVKQ